MGVHTSYAVVPPPCDVARMPPCRVIGQIKHARGFREFLLRGFEKVQGEWALVCTTHNILKLYRLCV
jgi:hypothetical protein